MEGSTSVLGSEKLDVPKRLESEPKLLADGLGRPKRDWLTRAPWCWIQGVFSEAQIDNFVILGGKRQVLLDILVGKLRPLSPLKATG